MKLLISGLVFFAAAFFLHLAIWRVRLPKRQTKVLLLVFFGTLVFELVLSYGILYFCPLKGAYVLQDTSEYLHISLFFISLTLAYMITYSALEADSPSLVMVMAIADAGPAGLSRAQFENRMNNDTLMLPRIRDIITDKMAYLDGDKYRLTRKGFLLAHIFVFYRNILKADKGG